MDLKSHFAHETFQPLQEETLDIIEENYDRYDIFIVEGPPGVGKTAIADAFIAAHSHGEALTKQIRLQDQYIDYGFKKVEGRYHQNCLEIAQRCDRGRCITDNSFQCERKPTLKPLADDLKAAESFKRGVLYWKNNRVDERCGYWVQKMDALNSQKVTHNYSYFLGESRYVGDFGSPPALVCDECHTIEQTIMNFVNFSLNREAMESIGVHLQNFSDPNDWLKWLMALSEHYIPTRLSAIDLIFKKDTFPNYNLTKEKKILDITKGKVDFFLKHYHKNPGAWLFLPHMDGNYIEKVEFKPLLVNEFVPDLLFQQSKKMLFMSATILDFPTFRRSIGLADKKCLEIQLPSPFKVENRLIYKANIGKLNAAALNPKNPENKLDLLCAFIDETLDNPKFRHEKGIIHTTSYPLAEQIRERCVLAPRMLFHSDSAGASEILEIHKNTNEPTVIVSPSMTEGVSLDDDLARFQIPVRVPFLNTMDPVIAARREIDMEWYNWMAGVILFQSCGRIVRNMKDYGTTIIPDSRLHNFLSRQLGWQKVPEWIRDSIRTTTNLEEDFGLDFEELKSRFQ